MTRAAPRSPASRLWLRAQKAWQRLGLKPAERPAIKRSNIVCAEPMPGEKELLREFVEREFPAEERAIFLRLLEASSTRCNLAGEAGSLLKIEEEIRDVPSQRQEAMDGNLPIRSGERRTIWQAEIAAASKARNRTPLDQVVSRFRSGEAEGTQNRLQQSNRRAILGTGRATDLRRAAKTTPSRPRTAADSSAGSSPTTPRRASPSSISAANATTWW